MRGGSWNNNPQNVRVANRNNNEPTNRNNNIGFRCAGYAERGLDLRPAGGSRFLYGASGSANSASGPLIPTLLLLTASNSNQTRVF